MHPQKISPAFAYYLGKAVRMQALLLAAAQSWSHGTTINGIAPGPMSPLDTLAEAVEHCQHGPSWLKRANLSPQDVADGIAFLRSESGRYITGCALAYLFHG